MDITMKINIMCTILIIMMGAIETFDIIKSLKKHKISSDS